VTELDSLVFEDSNVVVLGATNHVEKIEPDLLRPGRIDRLIYINLPTEVDRKEIINLLILNSQIRQDNITEYFTKNSDGFTGSALKECFRKACLFAIQRDSVAPILTKADIDSALEFQ
jgi:ATP-dependent 26S proteasome regulatory subunit